MTKYQVILWEDGVQKEVHNFELEYSQKGWYISTISISSFREREATRLYNYTQRKHSYNLPGKRCSVKFGSEIEFDEKQSQRVFEKYGIEDELKTLPRFKHDSVWDFYKAIGYNYKKKRYIS